MSEHRPGELGPLLPLDAYPIGAAGGLCLLGALLARKAGAGQTAAVVLYVGVVLLLVLLPLRIWQYRAGGGRGRY
ncbi:hypothetical protein [Streptomyces sp. NPDC047525]|uniref:hypothetical protein n=1 Tax=Streptomyces sp. NPDC047525 TaxID=3155264 RepID=UPI003410BFB5